MTTDLGTFSLLGLAPTGTADDVLGIWTPRNGRFGKALAFGPETASEIGEGPVWLAELPADPALARAAIDAAEARLRTAEQALPVAAERLVDFALRGRGSLSFAVAAVPQPDQEGAETELAQLLAEVGGRRPAVAFGPLDTLRAGWREIAEWFSSVVGSVLAPIAHLGPVRTELGDIVLAHTIVGLTGDVATAWRSGLTAAEVELHQRGVGLALATRAALMRVMALALRCATIAAAAFATPGGPLFALPAIWRFITRVQNEIAAIRRGFAGREIGGGQR